MSERYEVEQRVHGAWVLLVATDEFDIADEIAVLLWTGTSTGGVRVVDTQRSVERQDREVYRMERRA